MRSMILAVLLATAVSGSALAKPANVSASVAATAARSEANVKLDESRKPAEVLKFLGLQKGMRVLDMFGGNLYWAEIMAPAVGPKGRVIDLAAEAILRAKRATTITWRSKAKQPNVWLRVSPFEAPDLPANTYDFMLMNLDYHDVYWESAKSARSRGWSPTRG